jgi:hypothetical protein
MQIVLIFLCSLTFSESELMANWQQTGYFHQLFVKAGYPSAVEFELNM